MLGEIGHFLVNSSYIYLFIAVTGSVIFALQFVLTLLGLGGDTDADFDVQPHDVSDIAGLNFFSVKAICAFVTFFGWAGFFWGGLGGGWGGLLIAVLCGLLMMFLTALIVSFLLRMQQSGTISAAELVGQRGVVYLTVPSSRAAGGKVTVNLPGCTREVAARADDELKTGTAVIISEDLGDGSFLVARS